MNIAPFIHELILSNECVILPGFGGFETSYQAARIKSDEAKILAPNKTVVFRPDYKTGNGSLENLIIKRTGFSNKSVEQYIKEYINGIENKLNSDNFCIVDEVGEFTKTYLGEIKFKPYETNNYSVDSFGLGEVKLNTPLPYSVTKPKQNFVSVSTRPNTKKVVIIISLLIISLLALIITAINLSTYKLANKEKNEANNNSDLIVLGARQNDRPNDTLFIQISENIDSLTSTRNALMYNDSKEQQDKQIFHIIAGTFSQYNNAILLQTQLQEKNIKSVLISKNNSYQVSMGEFHNKQEALIELKKLRQLAGEQVWLLKK